MDVLTDGTGKGYRAQVNQFNQLSVIAESIAQEGAKAESGNAFIVHARCHTAAATSGGFLYIKNNDINAVIAITRIYIDPFTLSVNNLICTQLFDPTPIGGVDISETAIVNKNRGSANLSDLTILSSNVSGDLTFAGGTEYHAFPVVSRTSTQRDMQSTNVIPGGKAIAWAWSRENGTAAVDGEIVSFSVNFTKKVL